MGKFWEKTGKSWKKSIKKNNNKVALKKRKEKK